MSSSSSVSETSAASRSTTPLVTVNPLPPVAAPADEGVLKPPASRTQQHAVLDLLSGKLPTPPPIYTSRESLEAMAQQVGFNFAELHPDKGEVLNHTREITTEDIKRFNSDAHEDTSLDLVVYELSMLEDVLDEATTLLKGLHVDWENNNDRDWATQFMPYYTAPGLPAFFASEKDFEQWFAAVLGLPALAVCKTFIYDKLPTRMEAQAKRYPTLTSAYDSDIIPDMLLVRSGQYPHHVIPLVVEVKSTNVLKPQTKDLRRSSAIAAPLESENILYPIQDSSENVPSGHAIEFRCPADVEELEGNGGDHLTQLLVQVWNELRYGVVDPFVKKGDTVRYRPGPNILVLTSYAATTFFVRRGRVLYMSPTFKINAKTPSPLLVLFAVMAKELELIKAPYVTPAPNTTFHAVAARKGPDDGTWIGLNYAHMPIRVAEWAAEKTAREQGEAVLMPGGRLRRDRRQVKKYTSTES